MTNKIKGWYQKKIFPVLMNNNLNRPDVITERKNILSYVTGEILEIGIGTGNNLPLYPEWVTKITAIDSYIRKVHSNRIKVDLRPYSSEQMQFTNDSFDTVVRYLCEAVAVAKKENK